jgi:lysophospholipase L1-like esterase
MPTSLPRKLAYALVPVVVIAAAAEIGARLFLGPPPPDEGSRGDEFRQFLINFAMPREEADLVMRGDPDLFWRLQPNTPDLQIHHKSNLWIDTATNSLGLRDDEVVQPKPAGATRIVCLGDSCTYGSGVARRDTFPEQLQRELGVDVVDAGVPGYTSFQAVSWLERDGWALQPDILVFTLGFNDARSWDDLTDEEHLEKLRARRSGLAGLLRSSRLLQALRGAGAADREAAPMDISKGRRTRSRVPVDRYRAWLQRAADDAAAHGARILYLLWPAAGNLAQDADEDLSAHQSALVGFCREQGLPLVNPIAALRPERDAIYVGDDIHMNPRGNAIVAGEIAGKLRQLGWVRR